MDQVILVDENDKEVGLMEKLEAHRQGKLHRAFSVFLFNEKKELLLQQRAFDKYHSGGLWTNTCCSHPKPEERLEDAVNRRLVEEMGIKAKTKHAFSFIYKARLDKDLIEHELDHVFIGNYQGDFTVNPQEVAESKFVPLDIIKEEMSMYPDRYTIWFKLIFDRVHAHLLQVD